jgi:hypothetical protein
MSQLRRIASISMRGVKPNEDIGQAPELLWVSPEDLYVDEVYQRSLSEASITRIRKIITEFRWDKFTAPNVSEIDEGYRVLDGQHGAIAALCHPAIDLIPVLNTPGLTVEQQSAAFVSHARDRLNVTRTQIYHSALVAGDPEVVALERVLRRAGVSVRRNPPSDGVYEPGETMAVGTLLKLLRRRSAEVAVEMLTMLRTRAPVAQIEIDALDLLRHDPDFREDWDVEAITPIVAASAGYERREAEQIALVHEKPLARCLAVVWYRRVPRKVKQRASSLLRA